MDEEAGVGGRVRGVGAPAVMLSVAIALAACSSNGVDAQPGGPSTGSQQATPRPSASIDPRALPAVQAYTSFLTARQNGQRRPFGQDEDPPVNADVKPYAFDPMLARSNAYIWSLKIDGIAFRGVPPQSHASVISIDLEASPWPTVFLSDCLTGEDKWIAHDVSTGAVLPNTTPSVAPPYRSTVTVIKYENHWGVRDIKLDSSKTCTA